MTMQACFVNTEDPPVKSEHVCWFTNSQGQKVALHEVYREYFNHPDAPEDAIVSVTQTRLVRVYDRTNKRAANIVILEAAQNACSSLPIQG
jgi:hypothetical protein